jgi:hypothetical protein
MNRTELLCLANGLTPMLRLNENLIIAIDDSGNSFKVVTLPKHNEVKPHLLGPKCIGLCGYDLRRPHLTCGCCGWRLVKEGKRGPVEPCTMYFLTIMHNRKHRKLKDWLLKKWLSVAEYIANR